MSQFVVHAAVWIPVAATVAVAMDHWAALLHRAVWHRSFWAIHRSHHAPRVGRFEWNDVLSAIHAPVAVAFILYGCAGPVGALRETLFGVGLGMTAFGVAYVIVHDGLVHGRLPVRFLFRVSYFRAVAAAHKRHHENRPGGPPYGLFGGTRELRRADGITRSAERHVRPSRSPLRSPRPARAPTGRRPADPRRE